MKKIGFLSCFSLFLFIAYSQTQEPTKYFGSYTQPAPNVGSLGKYADYPVSYYTGTPNISAPIFELNDGAIKMPISLSYHASGIRVAELASWVGLGWSLNCGGMIARSVRGGPDEGVSNAQSVCRGYYLDYGISTLPMLPYPQGGIIPYNNTPNSAEIRNDFLQALNAGFADCEPDLFTFNFNGYTGKFVFDEHRTIKLLTEDNLKIQVSFDGTNFTTWTITTPDGIVYYFGENGMHEVTAVSNNNNLVDNNSLRPSSWFLTKVINPNTKDTVNLTYTTESYSYFDLGQEFKAFGGYGDQPLTTACSFNYDDVAKTIYKTMVTGLRLTNIKSRNYNIVFAARTARQDLTPTAYQLDSIRIYNSQNQCLKQYLLSYNYFKSTTAADIPPLGLWVINGDTSDCKRLKLLSLKEFSGDGLSSKPAYMFDYQESLQLPRRLSFDQDHWGFSNNSTGNHNDKFMPPLTDHNCTFGTGYSVTRDARWPDMQSFSIKSIKDPLGVTTTFGFESHICNEPSDKPLHIVGGLRIHTITTSDSLTNKAQVRIFQYEDGRLYKYPEYLKMVHNEYFLTSNSPFSAGMLGYTGYNFMNLSVSNFAVRSSQSVVPLQDFQGNHIGYPSVKEIFGPNGEGGSKVYNFIADESWNNSSRVDMSNYTATATVTYQYESTPFSGIFGNGLFNEIPPQNLSYASPSYAHYLYPLAPSQVDFSRGKLITEETYDFANQLVTRSGYRYEQLFHDTCQIRGFKLFRTLVGASDIYGPANFDALTYYKLHTGLSHLTFDTTTTYKDGKTFSTVHNYDYEDTLHTLQTSALTINSTGDTILNKTYYSFDYTNGADAVFAKMKKRNLLLPVSSRTWKNNKLIAGTITKYSDFATSSTDTFVNPIKIYGLETSTSLTPAQAGENTAFTTQYNTLLPSTYFKEKASFKVGGSTGKIIEQRLVNDKTQALIWDNNLSMPLAQVDNAVFSDVAYSSFESAEKGNWTYAAGSAVSDVTAPTGGKAYSLSGGLSMSSLTSIQKYILSYWQKSGASVTVTGGTQSNNITGRVLNGYTYKQVTITGTTSISLSGSGNIDEVRLYPATAQMTTYTYDGIFRLTTICNPGSSINYYEYDSMNRLVDIKDQFGNVVKSFEYNYGRSSRPGQ